MLDPHTVLRGLGVTASAVQAVDAGADTLIWRVHTPQGVFALRVFRAEQAAVAGREALVMPLLAGAGLPVPGVRAQATVDGRPALLIDWVRGEPLLNAVRADPTRVVALGRAFGSTQARWHQLQVPPDLVQRAREEGGLIEQPGGGRRALLHLDYHPLNVLVEGAQVSGVIDWANVRLGDPRLDVARTLSILSVDPGVRHLPANERAGVRALRRAYVDGYAQAGGRLDQLPPFLAWAGEFMRADLAPRYAATDLAPVARWTQHWRSRI